MYFEKFNNSDMKKFLIEKSNFKERNNDYYGNGWLENYHETIFENESFEEDEYYSEYNLEQIRDNKCCSYVYRIGVLYMRDANKCDFAEIHIAFQSDKDGKMIYLGKLNFEDGENMDLLPTIQRIAFSMIECLIWS